MAQDNTKGPDQGKKAPNRVPLPPVPAELRLNREKRGKTPGNNKNQSCSKFDQGLWDFIRAQYVEGVQGPDGRLYYPSSFVLAEEHGISRSTISQRAAKEGWTDQREIWQARLEQQRQEKKVDLLSKEAARFDLDIYKIVASAVSHIQGHFLIAQRKLQKAEGRDLTVQDVMTLGEINRLTMALERLQRVGRLALGEPLHMESGEPGKAGDTYYIVQEILNDESAVERIRRNYRSRSGAGPRE